jgi:hypothetical protein
MKNHNHSLLLGALAALVGVTFQGLAQSSSAGVRFKIPVGLTYAQGAYDVNDKLKESLREGGYDVTDDYVWPVGLTLNPRVEFPCGFGLGVTVGPTVFQVVERETGHDKDDELSYIIPLGAFVQYTLLRDGKVSPYLRAGFRFPITGGDNIKDGTIGAFGAVGVEFYRQKRVAFGFEVGYDSSEVTVTGGPGMAEYKVTPIGFNVTVFALF